MVVNWTFCHWTNFALLFAEGRTLATRAVLFSTEILLAMGLFSEAANQFLKMTTGVSSDIFTFYFNIFLYVTLRQSKKLAFYEFLKDKGR